MSPSPVAATFRVEPDPAAVARAAAALVTARAGEAIRSRGSFSMALSGGSTPRRLFETLASRPEGIEWTRVLVYWGDERCVPPEHEASNYRMARESLLDPAGVPAANVFRIRGEHDPREEAERYEEMLRATHRGVPRFDLVLLGLGEDGHTASLFPGIGPPLDEPRWVLGVTAPADVEPRERITLTYRALESSRERLVLVTGASKRDVVGSIASGEAGPARYPAARFTGAGSFWLLDEAAAGALAPGKRGRAQEDAAGREEPLPGRSPER